MCQRCAVTSWGALMVEFIFEFQMFANNGGKFSGSSWLKYISEFQSIPKRVVSSWEALGWNYLRISSIPKRVVTSWEALGWISYLNSKCFKESGKFSGSSWLKYNPNSKYCPESVVSSQGRFLSKHSSQIPSVSKRVVSSWEAFG